MSEEKRLPFAGYSFKGSLKKFLFREEPPRIGRSRKYPPPRPREHVIQRFNYTNWELLKNIWLNWAYYSMWIWKRRKTLSLPQMKLTNTLSWNILNLQLFLCGCFLYGPRKMEFILPAFCWFCFFFLCWSIKGIKTISPPGTIFEFDWNPCTTFTEGNSCTDMLVGVCFAFL